MVSNHKIFIINVGVNASHGSLKSPIFSDDTFEFIPIPEEGRWHSIIYNERLLHYNELNTYDSKNDISKYIPKKYIKKNVHNDPEFLTFTYSDYPTKSPRAANLKRIQPQDFLFFFARLVHWKNGKFLSNAGFYFIGFFEIKTIYKNITKKPNNLILDEVIYNAHVIRGLLNPSYWNSFWIFKGTKNSKRFKKAVPFTREVVEKIIKTKKGSSFGWDRKRTDLQIIGSYTRACRIINNSEKINWLWKYVKFFNTDIKPF